MPLLISIILFLVFTALLYIGKLDELSYSFLVTATALLGLVLHGFDRLKELDLKNLRIVLNELEETKKELFVREEKLKAIAIPLAHIVALTSVSEGRMSSKETWSAKRKWYKKKLEDLMLSLDFTTDEEKEAKKFIEIYDEIDRLFTDREDLKTTDADYDEVMRELKRLNNELTELMRQDSKE